ncbi:unnamed protein product [Pleuronectes platessa]|uniref:Uncharacterized protein n=1 Tax=Pleuronectes platessa TaxID=8262 RepID=A0A9N7UU24_PLEPL|nr:unnamed protein product [Pleuronectes platessa]
MKAFQPCACLSAVIRAVLIPAFLLTSVRGDEADSEEGRDIEFILIGAGIGLFLSAGFIINKVCMIRKHVRDNSSDATMKRPKEKLSLCC